MFVKLGDWAKKLAVMALTLVIAGCTTTGQSPSPGDRSPAVASESPASPSTPPASARDADFELTAGLDVPAAGFRSGDPIPFEATYRFAGPEPSLVAGSDYEDLVYFSLEQLDGPLDQAGGISRLVCHTKTISHGALVQVPFRKEGGYLPTDPNALFWDSYFADSVLRLPAGQWRIAVHLSASIRGTDDPCVGETHALETSMTLEVAP
jgi:hypothetical protein